MHCYSLINNFNDLDKLGKDLYLTEKIGVATKNTEELKGEAYAMEVIESNTSAKVTPYGVLYKNSNQPEQVYNGKNFPPYLWKESMATVELKVRGEHEFVYLPSSDIEILGILKYSSRVCEGDPVNGTIAAKGSGFFSRMRGSSYQLLCLNAPFALI